MKYRNILTLVALGAAPLVAQNVSPASIADQPAVVSTSEAPAVSNDLLQQLKERVDPNYVKGLGTCSDHSTAGKG